MKNIVFIFSSLGLGGSQKIEAFVANACAEEGYNVSAIVFSNDEAKVKLNPSISVYNANYHRGKDVRSKIIFLFRLRRMIKQLDPNLICVFLADITRVVVYACTFMDIPIIASERGAPSKHGKRFALYERAFQKCSNVVFQTDFARRYYRLIEEKTSIIPNPCFITHDYKTEDYYHSEKLIISGGRFSQQKRFDVLIDAFSIVIEKHPEYSLKIFGDGELKQNLESQIKSYGLNEKIQLCNYSENLFFEAGLPDVFVLSSDYEGVPNVLMEAMSLGIPCVATDCEPGGPRMLFDNETRGILANVGDPFSLANKITIIIKNKELARSLGSSAKKIVKDYNPQKIVKKWLDLLKNYAS